MKLSDLQNKINEFDPSKEFASFISENFVGQSIEIYFGDHTDMVSVEQQSFYNPAVFCGKIMGVVGSFIVLDCFSQSKNKITNGNIMFINIDSITALKMLNTDRPMKNAFIKSGSYPQKVMNDE